MVSTFHWREEMKRIMVHIRSGIHGHSERIKIGFSLPNTGPGVCVSVCVCSYLKAISYHMGQQMCCI